VLSLVTLANNMATALNLALANDLVEHPRDISRVVGLTIFGGNVFGLMSPIVTGYVVGRTGTYHPAFYFAAAFLIMGAVACFVLSRKGIPAAEGISETRIPGGTFASTT
jgi:cyanate permease